MISRQNILRYSIAILFIVFGGLKFFPEMSPAEMIGIETVKKLTFGLLPDYICIYALGILEVTIGLMLMISKCTKCAIILAVGHLIMTFTPFLFFPTEMVGSADSGLSLLGQYIIKNIVIISALLMIYPTNNQSNYAIAK